MNTYKKDNHTFKRKVQNLILDTIPNMRSSVLTMVGPNVKEVYDLYKEHKIISKAEDKIISWECDEDTFNNQFKYNLLSPYTMKNKFLLNKGNIEDVKLNDIVRFIDLDLMNSFKKNQQLIKKLFNNQHYKFALVNKLKVFNFTVCTRYKGFDIDYIIHFLRELLQLPSLEIQEKITHKPINEYKLIYTGKYYIKMYLYKDGASMLSVSIQYK